MNWTLIAGVIPVQGRQGGRFIANCRNRARTRSRIGMGGRGVWVMDARILAARDSRVKNKR
jgi:hypothetical protein